MFNNITYSRKFLPVWLSIYLLFNAHQLFSQNENDQWIFGGAPFPTNPPALSFVSGTPVPVPTTPTSSFWTTEAAAAVAHGTTGALLFYTDAVNVFTSSHAIMPNGGGTLSTQLNGCTSTTQGALILPRPGVTGHYYIFTLDCSENHGTSSYSGLRFSEVDMSLNGGNGDVISGTRNTLLWGPPSQNKLTEKLTAARHANGTDYWVITHEWTTNNFLAFAVTCEGVSMTPVISATGTVHISGSSFPEEVIGAMKVSQSGTRLALVAGYGIMNVIEIFDFNSSTGIVSNPVSLSANGNDYGIEFSPNSQRLYVTVYNSIPCCSGTLFQYNLAAGSAALIQASKVLIATSASFGYGGLQLGPDNKIYVSRVLQTNNLGVIALPDNLGGACGFSNNGPVLSGRRCSIGLINLITFQSNPVCLPLPVELLFFSAIANNDNTVSIKWRTSSEINNDYFILEKSVDGIFFSKLAIIDGAGNSTSLKDYFYKDISSASILYYKLTQVDFNGELKILDIITVKSGQTNFFAVSYNSGLNSILLFLDGETGSELFITICTVQGIELVREKILHAELNNGVAEIPLQQHIRNSLLFISIHEKSQPVYNSKIFVTD